MYCEWMDEVCLEATEEEIQEYEKRKKRKREIRLSLKDRFAIWLLNL